MTTDKQQRTTLDSTHYKRVSFVPVPDAASDTYVVQVSPYDTYVVGTLSADYMGGGYYVVIMDGDGDSATCAYWGDCDDMSNAQRRVRDLLDTHS